jgi:hypothetical protein
MPISFLYLQSFLFYFLVVRTEIFSEMGWTGWRWWQIVGLYSKCGEHRYLEIFNFLDIKTANARSCTVNAKKIHVQIKVICN